MGNKALPSICVSTSKAEKEPVISALFSAWLKIVWKKEKLHGSNYWLLSEWCSATPLVGLHKC